MSRMDIPKKINTAKKEAFSKLMGTTIRTIDNHVSDEKLYIKFLDQFTIEEIHEFVENKRIERLELACEVPLDTLREIANSSKHDFDEHMLKGALYKIQFGMDGNLILPIFRQSIETLSEIDGEEIRKKLNKKVLSYKSSVWTHKNHKKMVAEFIEKFLTNRELELLLEYYRKENKQHQ